MTTDSSTESETLGAETPLAEAEPARGTPARPHAPEHGRHRPPFAARAAMSAGRLLPKGETGLRLAGALKPLALSGAKGPRDVVALGLKLRLHPYDNLTEKRLLVTPQCVDPEELAVVREVMGPGRSFLDIGANSGLYSLVAALAGGPKSAVLAVEPQSEMRRRLSFNARQNDLGNINIAGVALSDYEGEDVLRLVDGNLGGTRLEASKGGDGEAVRVRKLTNLLDEYRWTKIDLMKIDVEGDEWRILAPFFAEAPETLFPERIIMERFEVNASIRDDVVDPMPRLARLGYREERQARRNVILRRSAPAAA
jgi:FkbM family methyltransferase